METFEYYQIIQDGVIFVYERETEFFALYSPSTKKWCQPENLTFMQLAREREYQVISKEQAHEKTDSLSLEALFGEYVALIKRNRRL